LENCYIHDNIRWGIEAASGNAWLDGHLANCHFFYNRLGHAYFGGSKVSGAVDWVNCRFDRAGANPTNVGSPYNASAPGVRLASARFFSFTNCSTDANMGSGFDIVHEADTPNYLPNNILLTSCRFNRDGTGDQATLGAYAGLKVRGTNTSTGTVGQVKAVNCIVAEGKADDGGGGTIVGPKYGVWYENASHFQCIGGNISATSSLSNNEFYEGAGGNWRAMIYNVELGLFSLPMARPGTGLPVPDGSAYYDASASRFYIRGGGTWKSVPVS